MSFTLDTNVLVYAFDTQADARGTAARALIEALAGGGAFLALQTLAETANVLLRRRVPPTRAMEYVAALDENFSVEPATGADLTEALKAVKVHKLAFWDAMLWATCRRAGATTLFTEDMQDGRTLSGVRFVNPFAAKNARYLP
ncbi:MAG: PIN domain-containing protein [Proteobacteria bacterium]|nr:PIN domain-containing protein [Pseudomonadota bacterium]